jgi:hypothetical protein
VDIVAFIISVSVERINIHPWFYWIVAGVGFIIANIQLFINQENIIRSFESDEANINIQLVSSEFKLSYDLKRSTTDQSVYKSKDKLVSQLVTNTGLPIRTELVAQIEVENTGKEDGELIWEIDRKKSILPSPFKFFKDSNGRISLHRVEQEGIFSLYSVPGARIVVRSKPLIISNRSRNVGTWSIHLFENGASPKDLACSLSEPGKYEVYILYQTKRIGGINKARSFVIRGDLNHYRQQIVDEWGKTGFSSLVTLGSKER